MSILEVKGVNKRFGGLQALGDAVDAGQHSLKQVFIFASAGTPTPQQVHLHQVHRINVGIAQGNGPLQGPVTVQQLAGLLNLQ